MMLFALTMYVFLPALCLFGVRKKAADNTLSKDITTEIRGIGMLLIVLAHAVEQRDDTAAFFFYVSAVLGVGACFFVSGYGLYKSFASKKDYLDRFLLSKFSRVLVPYFLLFIISLIFRIVLKDSISLKDVFLELITLRMDGLLLWYLKIQLLLYVFFFLSFRFFSEKKIVALFVFTIIYIIIAWKSGLTAYWYNTCLFFLLGVVFAKYEKKLLPVITSKFGTLVSLGTFLFLFLVIFFFGRLNIEFIIDFFYIFSFVAFILSLLSFFSGSKVLSFSGKYSMEIYLIHLLLLRRSMFGLFSSDKLWSYLLLLAATAFFSWFLYPVDNRIIDKLLRRKREG